jgi:hypothetical protein
MCYFRLAIKKHSHTDTQQVFVYFTHATSTLHPLLCTTPLPFSTSFLRSSVVPFHHFTLPTLLLCSCQSRLGSFLCNRPHLSMQIRLCLLLPALRVRCPASFLSLSAPCSFLPYHPKIMINIFPSLDTKTRLREQKEAGNRKSPSPVCTVETENTHFLPSRFYRTQCNALSHAHTTHFCRGAGEGG